MARRIMRAFKLNEISAVDRPAQAHAKMVLMKRADDEPEYWKAEFSAEERRQLADEGKAKPDGSYPIRNRSDLMNAIRAWGRGGATASDKEWIIRRARALGATDALPDNWTSKAFKEIDSMTKDELNQAILEAYPGLAEIPDLAKQLKAAQDELAATVAKMGGKKGKPAPKDESNDDNDGDEDAAKALEPAVVALKAELAKAQADANEIIKAQGEEIAKMREERELDALTKVAERDYAHLPGKAVEKAKTLRALAKLGDEERKTIEAMLKGGEAAIRQGFNEIGKRGSLTGNSAEQELDALAKAYATEKSVPFTVAYGKVLETDAGKELYKRHADEMRRFSN